MSLLIKFKLNDSTIPGTLYADLSDGKNQKTNLKLFIFEIKKMLQSADCNIDSQF